VIATSWSDNPRKGGETLEWLDDRVERLPVEVTFVGRTQARLQHIRTLPPAPSDALATLLRNSDAYLAPSLNDPCSNALLEALACGLPAVYARSGGHPELVGNAGIGFSSNEELVEALERLPAELNALRDQIRIASLPEVADRYLEALGA
jgi:glycosyltransferase involved in cell wall biosynthesis